ncbi:hypothetical protein KKA93_00415 [Patescibacteria group bacterium]|nr:hypothetical protein [Patescibacteria group bacterium]MBU1663428.1 hypothetical protein [Patescibacteria group bacterium]MBU1933648.1 hypothetical protein [Patescibacteria group bacterium]
MKYFFILGTNPTLSLAELAAVFNHGEFSLIQKNIAFLDIDYEIRANIIKKIGGTIKFGLIHSELNSITTKDILKSVVSFSKSEKKQSKFNFGFSYYGKSKIYPVNSSITGITPQSELSRGINLKILGMEFKKLLKLAGINSRWVISRAPTLSSVVVEQNKLVTDKGAEIVMIEFNKKLFLGKTIAVQPFKELSFRDYGRPARDDRSGMLPPKLAQIMINLALAPFLYQEEDWVKIVLDPFCGSGTIITEALLMEQFHSLVKDGIMKRFHLIGSDISDQAICNTKTNIEWIKKNYELQATSYEPRATSCELRKIDATQISKQIQPNSVDAIITEPYLGPQRNGFEIAKVVKDLEQLYSKSLMEFKKILKPMGRIVMIWPVFQKKSLSSRSNASDRGNLTNANIKGSLSPNLSGFKIINPIPANLQKNIFLKLTARHTMIYGREKQRVWREIVVLEKHN